MQREAINDLDAERGQPVHHQRIEGQVMHGEVPAFAATEIYAVVDSYVLDGKESFRADVGFQPQDAEMAQR